MITLIDAVNAVRQTRAKRRRLRYTPIPQEPCRFSMQRGCGNFPHRIQHQIVALIEIGNYRGCPGCRTDARMRRFGCRFRPVQRLLLTD